MFRNYIKTTLRNLGYAYRIEIQGWIFLAAGLTAILIALVTISFQAIRAAIANPVNSLCDQSNRLNA